MSDLNTSQMLAVRTEADSTLVIAGPGAGKTRVLTERIRVLAQQHGPQSIAVVTFTNAAAKEIEARILKAGWLAPGATVGYVGTLHGLMLRALQRFGQWIGFPKEVAVLSEENATRLLEAVIHDLKYKGTKRQLQAQLRMGPEIMFRPAGVPIIRKPLTPDQLVCAEYYRRQKESGFVDMDSILNYGAALMTELASKEPQAWPYDHLLVDEFQDSGLADDEIYRWMPVRTRFFVGDPDQSIFGFRGGTVENIVRLAKKEGQCVVFLDENYRCAVDICRHANRLIRNNKARVDKLTMPSTPMLGFVHIVHSSGEISEIMTIAEVASEDGPETCAVLLRYNALVERYAKALQGLGVAIVAPSTGYPKDWKLCRQLVALFSNPANDLLAYWFICETQGVRAAQKAKVSALGAGCSINDIALKIKVPKDSAEALATLPEVLAKCGIERESLERVGVVIKALPQASGLADLTIGLADDDLHRKEEGSGLTVTTIHSAKGREWDTVFLPAFETGIIPSVAKSASIEEERRLAFVAVTRAARNLYVMHCKSRAPLWGQGSPEDAKPSVFLGELMRE